MQEKIVQSLVDAFSEVDTAEKRLAEAKTRVKETIRDVSANLTDEDARKQVVWELYWKHEEIGAQLIASIFPDVETPSAVLEMRCFDCGKRIEVEVTSRSNAKAILKGESTYNPVKRRHERKDACASCLQKTDEAIQARRVAIIEGDEHRKARLQELRTMPYAEYLKTPEWKARREQQLRSAHYRCQVCNNTGLLNVHHRTYERRGNENFKDLLVLCANCHEIFHKQGKLAEVS